MSDGSFHLLRCRRFLPLFAAQFLGAANDNLFKNALVILIVYRLGEGLALPPQILVTLAAGLFILPFFLLSATAGQMSDRFEKSGLIKRVKLAEVAVAALGVWSLFTGSVTAMLVVLFGFGVQATFFGPLKYAVLPEHLAETELVGGNALIEGGTFIAILVGTIAGGLLILAEGGVMLVSVLMLALAAAGYVASLFLPIAHPGNASVRVSANIMAETLAVLRLIRGRRDLFLSVLGISWFWLMGATFLAQFPAFAKDVLVADQHVVTLLLTVFSVGIGIGSVLCGRLLKGEISARPVPFAALGMTLFSFDLYFASAVPAMPGAALAGVAEFLSLAANWRVLGDLLAIAICGGLYIVPLYTILQSRADEGSRARAIAANNIMNAAFMVISAAAGALMLGLGFSVPQVFLVQAGANLVVAVYICGLLPDAFLKGLFAWVLRRAYGVRVEGLEHLAAAGDKAVIVVNHVSFLDAVLMAAFLPGRPSFAINTFVARLWWVRPFLSVVDATAIDPTNPMSTKTLIHAVQGGRRMVIFPEGRITVTGALMKIYEGPGMIADKSDAPVVPVRIDGAQFTLFSRLKGKVRRHWFPRITITILAPRRFEVPERIKGRARRQYIGAALYDVMSGMMFETSDRHHTLFQALVQARRHHGGDGVVLDDVSRKPLTYTRLIAASHALGRVLAGQSRPGEAVGLLLPNVNAVAVAFFALQSVGRVPAMLNFSTGADTVLAACRAAGLETVVTSRRFIAQARLDGLVTALAGAVRVLYLEDLAPAIGPFARLAALAKARFGGAPQGDPESRALILFTSGSEGTPKGVVLSHANLLANCAQLAARVAFSPQDIVFNALPVFHSFGMTGGLLLPLLNGLRVFLYPSPLHYRIVPELVYDTNATIVFGTDTFLAGYGRVAAPYDFYSVRYVFAGAEKVKDETRRVWMDKFGIRILEGYGATETGPVLAVNTPMHHKAGTVGRLLPGIEARLEAVPGIDEGARLLVRGPNVMKGYLRAEAPGVLQPPEDGWYDTGDMVTLDEMGFVRIVGRIKRFAKIAGEMVSLGKVEAEAALLWPDSQVAVVAVPDDRKGEQLVLVTDRAGADRAQVLAHFKMRGLAELLVPRTVMVVGKLPLLGTGKTDYVALKSLVEGGGHA
ncbi:2-acyl-glycerophospho-ethanolamine acyltransferase [Paramagnetospirillum marisnigri]|uniref:2-acyl-glycerophospho-ethanolamine acyltransferase n=1 Tax=Paramagnetospirillum marisnigri TaxID=1285242 RepID=A0A178MXB1_9PROT|nr:acyl-[ACP]--phospholipid O-acyltransferase [Paramagnetospirillum marisnigri]OAN55946.1 2-acyl-glycerophospho-ethanolamine acyltransferase [Paramagnetospirillum marisnigri]